MLTRNVSLIEGLLNDEKKLLQFLDGKYQQYKEYSDCTLDVRYVGNKPYYSFHRTAESPLYLGSADNVFVQNIQNCRTYRDLSAICRDNVQAIEELLSQYTPITPNNLEELLPKHYLPPQFSLAAPPASFNQKWYDEMLKIKNLIPPTFPEALKIPTNDGIMVRSRVEAIIYNYFLSLGMTPLYEFPLSYEGKLIRPDFTLLHPLRPFIYIWEHFGRMFRPTEGLQYQQSAIYKLNVYKELGFYPGCNLFFSFENPDGSIDTENLIKEISQIFGNPPTAQALRLGIDATDFLEMQKNILQSQNVI